MKKFFTLIALVMITLCASAQTPVEGVDFSWKKVKSSMTTVPTDFCEGVSAEVAKAKADDAWANTIYGNLPVEGGEFSVVIYDWMGLSLTTKTWEQILAAIEDFDEYYYPAKIERPEGSPILGVDFEWVLLTAENTTAPTDICAGVIQDDAQLKINAVDATGAIFGELPQEGGSYKVLYDDWGSAVEKNLTWDKIYELACDSWESIYYPKSITSTAIKNTSTEDVKVQKVVENGRVVIIKNGMKYSVSGKLINNK